MPIQNFVWYMLGYLHYLCIQITLLLTVFVQQVVGIPFPLHVVQDFVVLLNQGMPTVLSSMLGYQGQIGCPTILLALKRLDHCGLVCISCCFLQLEIYTFIILTKDCVFVASTSDHVSLHQSMGLRVWFVSCQWRVNCKLQHPFG